MFLLSAIGRFAHLTPRRRPVSHGGGYALVTSRAIQRPATPGREGSGTDSRPHPKKRVGENVSTANSEAVIIKARKYGGVWIAP